MKQITVKAILLLMAVQVGLISLSSAQKREKTERIIIEKKSNKPEKMVIEIDGDKIKVNGKEVKDGDSNVIVREFGDMDFNFRMPKVYSYRGPLLEMRAYENMHRNWKRMGKVYAEQHRNLERNMRNMKERMEKRAFLGVGTEKTDKGLKITEITKESAAAAAGLQESDIITKVDGVDMKEEEDLVQTIRKHKPGDEVTIEYLSDGKKKTTKASLKSIEIMEEFKFNLEPKEFPQLNFDGLRELELLTPHGFNGDNNVFMFRKGPRLGATIQDTEDGKGVTVEEVDADAPAAKSGLQKGDIITEMNGKKITDVNDAREAIRESKDKNLWSIQVLRNGKPVTIEVKIPKDLKKTELKP